MNQCRDCRWWREYDWEPPCGECDLANLLDGKETHPGSKAFAAAVHGETWLETTPDFGCVQWEAKDADE